METLFLEHSIWELAGYVIIIGASITLLVGGIYCFAKTIVDLIKNS
jgi:hypothetical protein